MNLTGQPTVRNTHMTDNRKMPRTLLAEGVDDAVLGEDSDWSDEDDVQATKAAVSGASDASPKRKDSIPSTRDLFGASSSSEDEAGDSVQAKKPTKMTTADLFGDDSSDLDEGEDAMDLGALDDANSSQQQLDEEEGYTSGERERERSASPARRIGMELPRRPRLADGDVYVAKMPNFLNLEQRPFDPETFVEEGNDDDDDDQRVKLKVENTIRWRHGADGKESNARFVKWSDGTLSLMLGQECFDVPVKSLQEQHQYLYLVHRAQGSLEAQKHMTAMMGFRPTSTSSRTHKKLTATVLAKHQRTFKTKIVHAYHDPEAAKREAEKREQEQIKNRRKLAAKRRQTSRAGMLTASSLEAEEMLTDEEDYDDSMRFRRTASNEGAFAERRQQVDNSKNDYEEDDFVVDDDFVEVAEETDDLSDIGDDSDEDRRRDDRIQAAKTQAPGVTVDKKRRMVLSDDEDEAE